MNRLLLSSLILASLSVPVAAQMQGGGTSITGSQATDPTSTFTRPANTTAYSSGNLIASSTTAGSIVVPSFSLANYAGSAIIPKIGLATNATTGWGVTLTMNLWTSAPTYTNGDGGAYAVATSGAGKYYLGQFSCILIQFADGASGECSPAYGNVVKVTLPSGVAIYWDLQATGTVTPISQQTFTATARVLN